MVYIKKLVIHGFKSFARKTEIFFDRGINVFVGANGGGKSNVAEALCFVLGRLSIKSIRAAKARNLLFMGSKYIKPAREASVELVFDNTNRAFSIDKDEVVIKRIVRYNGQGVYKINDETKTRLDLIEMLAQAGIDPYGFNLVLQGQIQSIVKMHPEDRRKIIEEVAGISIYELRKEKSLHELEKTEGKIKEVAAILRERAAYLRNLEFERTQALRFKELELTNKRCKASLLAKKMHEKAREKAAIERSISEREKGRGAMRTKAEALQKESEQLSEAMSQMTKHLQKASGLEQESLHTHIANLKAEIEGLRVRREHYEHRKGELARRRAEMEKTIPALEQDITELQEESPLMAKKSGELVKKKEELAKLEEERKRVLTLKAEERALSERLKDKERALARVSGLAEVLMRQLEEHAHNATYAHEHECARAVTEMRQALAHRKKTLEEAGKEEWECERQRALAEAEIERAEKIAEAVTKIDVCPLCRSTISEDHVKHVRREMEQTATLAHQQHQQARGHFQVLQEQKRSLLTLLHGEEEKLTTAEIELVKHRAMKEKHDALKEAVEEEKALHEEIAQLERRRRQLEEKAADSGAIEEQYDAVMREIEEISSRTQQDTTTTLLYRQRDLEGSMNILKRSTKDLEELQRQIDELGQTLNEKSTRLEEREGQERAFHARFRKMLEEREALQKHIQEKTLELSELQSEIQAIEDQANYLRIGRAKLDAEHEALQMELAEYQKHDAPPLPEGRGLTGGARALDARGATDALNGAVSVGPRHYEIELLQGSVQALEERMKRTQEALAQIGSINLRALEVYEQIKKAHDEVQAKVTVLEQEKQDTLSIITEIDQKKKRSFMKTFKAMNELFSENFMKLSSKGTAFLELESEEDIFSGGVGIVVKLAKGKYFDVTSLSGGEQTLVALSLLFAIQEYKPYHFYIFDEIDAALDKRNSERLAVLLNQYMKSGQYIVITHNDELISKSHVLYGVSMHDGVSKILTLKVGTMEQDAAQALQELAPLAGGGAAIVPQPQLPENAALESDELMPADNADGGAVMR